MLTVGSLLLVNNEFFDLRSEKVTPSSFAQIWHFKQWNVFKNQVRQFLPVVGRAWGINPIPNRMPTLACVYQVNQWIVMVIYAWFYLLFKIQMVTY